MTIATARSATAAAGLAACAMGLLGVDAGLVWIVVGVMTVRSICRAPVGLTWSIACLGAGLRWGTLGLGDLETATRLLGPSVLAGAPAVRIGMTLAVIAAVLDEAAIDGLRSRSWAERAAAVVAAVTLAPLFLVVGPTNLESSVLPWVTSTAGVVAAVALITPIARRVPPLAAPAAAALGVVVPLVA